jgi:16S rRNA (uracil1498-N3)-methyltransferase
MPAANGGTRMGNFSTRGLNEPPRFVVSGLCGAPTARIAGPEFHHMRRVLRLSSGAAVVLVDGAGAEYRGRIKELHRDFALVEILSHRQKVPCTRRVLGVAIIKGWRMDFLVEKAAELGASELWPLRCARSVVREAGVERVDRWRRLATAAAKQCLSPLVMEIRPVCAFAQFLECARSADLAVLCRQGAPPLGTLARRRTWAVAVVACGPEGGFTGEELENAQRAGFVLSGLGPYRLRTETAALAALSVLADAGAGTAAGEKP